MNALRSWREIHPDSDILVFGAVPGAAEAAAKVNAILIPEVRCSPTGAPSFDDMAAYASAHGRYDMQVYVNSDILLDGSIARGLRSASQTFEQFLLVGERIDLGPSVTLELGERKLVDILDGLARSGQLWVHGPTGADYFGFKRGLWVELPSVFMGRGLCDQALLHFCLGNCIPVIDATFGVLALHQFHDYEHIQGGLEEVFRGQDRASMALIHGLRNCLPTVADADWRFGEGGEIEPAHRRSGLRQLELTFRYRFGFKRTALAMRALQHVRGKAYLLPKPLPLDNILKAWKSNGSIDSPIAHYHSMNRPL